MLDEQDSSPVPHIDLHTHILPGVDDGPESTEHSVELIAKSVRQGAVGIAATPHRSPWDYHESITEMEVRLGNLRQACRDAGLDVELYLGGETFLIPELLRPGENPDIVTLNKSRYLLFELPFNHYPPYAEEVIFELQLRGYKPVLAHAERYTHYHQDVNRIIKLLERGVLAQINAGSLAGAPRERREDDSPRSCSSTEWPTSSPPTPIRWTRGRQPWRATTIAWSSLWAKKPPRCW